MQNKKFSVGPSRITNAAANYLNPPAASGGVGVTSAQVAYVNQITLINTDSSTRTVSLYKGATAGSAGGTEIIPPGYSIAALSQQCFYFNPPLRFEVADFLSGLASVTNVVNIIIDGEVGVTG
jgi:hypothetical protein